MPDASLQRKLRNWQMLLLDLTRANRLLYFKTERGSSVPITAPAAADLFHLLVSQGKPLKFPAGDQSALFEEETDESSSPRGSYGSGCDQSARVWFGRNARVLAQRTGLCDTGDALFSHAMPVQNRGPGFRLASACQPSANTSFGTPASRVAHDDSGAARTPDTTT